MKITFQLIIIILSFIVISYLTKPLRAEISLKNGIVYVDNGYPFKAIDEYKKAEELDPVNERVYFQQGVAYGKIGQKNGLPLYKEYSIHAFKKAIDYTEDRAVDFYLAAGYEEKGDADSAFEVYKNIIKNDPEGKSAKEALNRLKDIYKDKGDKFFKDGNREEAIKKYKKVVELNGVNINWGREEDYERYAEVMPGNILANYWLGLKYYSIDDKDKAVKKFEEVKNLGFFSSDIKKVLMDLYNDLGKFYYKNNMIDKSVENYLKLIDFGNDNSKLFEIAVYAINDIYQAAGKFSLAVDILKRLEDFDSTKGDGYYHIGVMYEKRGMYKEAVEAFEDYLKVRDRKDIKIFYRMGSLYDKLDNLPKLVETYMFLEAFDTTKGEGYYNIGLMYEKRKMDKEAIEAFEKYLNYTVNNYEVYFKLGELYKNKKEWSKSIGYYNKSIESNIGNINKLNSKSYFALADIYNLIGQKNNSIDFINKGLAVGR